MPRKGPLSLIAPLGAVQQRPDPPKNLPPEEAEVWRRMVGAMRPGWCNGATEDLIRSYCFYAVQAADYRERVRAMDSSEKGYATLLSRLGEIVRHINVLSTRLRIAPSSTRTRQAHDPAANVVRPWEDDASRRLRCP